MGPVEPRFEEANPDTLVFHVDERTEFFVTEERRYVVIKTRQHTFTTTAPIHINNTSLATIQYC